MIKTSRLVLKAYEPEDQESMVELLTNDEIKKTFMIPDFQNRGYATEALSAAIGDLFQKGFGEIIAGAFENNTASCRVMEKCKMTRTEREETIKYREQLYHCIYYSIKKPE